MPDRLIRVRLPWRVYVWLEKTALEAGLEDGSEELIEELLIQCHHRFAPRRRRPARPAKPVPAE